MTDAEVRLLAACNRLYFMNLTLFEMLVNRAEDHRSLDSRRPKDQEFLDLAREFVEASKLAGSMLNGMNARIPGEEG